MPLPATVTSLLNDMSGYIKQSSADAAKYFIQHKIAPEIFTGTRMDLSEETCEMIYKEMIIEIMQAGSQVSFKYGLMVTMLPVKRKGSKIMVMIHLGMSFPDRHSKRSGSPFSIES